MKLHDICRELASQALIELAAKKRPKKSASKKAVKAQPSKRSEKALQYEAKVKAAFAKAKDKKTLKKLIDAALTNNPFKFKPDTIRKWAYEHSKKLNAAGRGAGEAQRLVKFAATYFADDHAARQKKDYTPKQKELRIMAQDAVKAGGPDAADAKEVLDTMPKHYDNPRVWIEWARRGPPSGVRLGPIRSMAAEIGEEATKEQRSAKKADAAPEHFNLLVDKLSKDKDITSQHIQDMVHKLTKLAGHGRAPKMSAKMSKTAAIKALKDYYESSHA